MVKEVPVGVDGEITTAMNRCTRNGGFYPCLTCGLASGFLANHLKIHPQITFRTLAEKLFCKILICPIYIF